MEPYACLMAAAASWEEREGTGLDSEEEEEEEEEVGGRKMKRYGGKRDVEQEWAEEGGTGER